MYTILVKSDDTLVTSVKENIFHRTSLVKKLRFLVDPEYKYGDDVSDIRSYVCTLEYKTPISETYIPVILSPSVELYKNKVEYLLPIDTSITSEVGIVELKLTWMKLSVGDDGSFKEQVRKTPSIGLEVLPVAQWGDYVADSKLDNIAQILLTAQSQNEQMKVYAEQLQALGQMFMVTKADNVKYDDSTGELQLTSMGNPIGNKPVIKNTACDNGVPVVEFGNGSSEDPDNTEIDNVVEFGPDENDLFDNVVTF